MRRPQLSICIPTYNRADYLKESLLVILEQIHGNYETEIEIVISNNASDDNTNEIVLGYKAMFSNIKINYILQNENIGFLNASQVCFYATGYFIWILSDDDCITPNAIKVIMGLIDSMENVNTFLVNHYIMPEKNQEPIISKTILGGNIDKNKALIFLGPHITFLSAVIVESQVFTHQLTTIPNDEFSASWFFLKALSQGNIYSIPEPLLLVRPNNSGGYNFYRVFLENFYFLMKFASKNDFDEAAIKIVKRKMIRLVITFTVLFKVNGKVGKLSPSFKEGIKHLKKYYASIPSSYVLLLFLLSPSFFIEFLKRSRDCLINGFNKLHIR